MAKGSNPADAHRKQLKKKELAKNKEQRKKTREISTVKKDTRCASRLAYHTPRGGPS